MLDTIKSRYKVTKSPEQASYEQQIGLKQNEEYRKMVEKTFLQIVNLFIGKYKGVSIEPPRGREKSYKSLKGKIDKLEIERLCKLYAIEGISKEDKKRLCNLVISHIEPNGDKEKTAEIQKEIEDIFYGEINSFEQVEKLISKKQLSDNMKTACLRVSKIRLENGESLKNEKILNDIENNFGQEAAARENKEEKDLLHWECVEEVKNSKSIEKLHRPMEYLKAKDLRAFKIVIANVPDDAKTENGQLQKIIEERKNAPEDEIKKYNAKCCIELEKDFAQYLLKNTEILQKMGIQILNEGYKRKNKANGYIADHIKFSYIEHPEYTFELQLRSLYIEELSRANGPAAHDKRSGKARIFPNTENSEEFIKQLKQSVPDYTILERAENGYKIKNCTLMENMLEYYLGYIDTNSPEYQTGVKHVRKYMEENKLNKELK